MWVQHCKVENIWHGEVFVLYCQFADFQETMPHRLLWYYGEWLASAIIIISYFNHLFKGSDEDLLTFPDICALCLLTGLKNFHWGMNVWPWAAFHSSNTCLNFCALWQSFVQHLYTYFSSFIIDEAGTLESDLSSHTMSDHIQIINLNKLHKNHKFQFFSPVKEEISYLSRII